MHCTRSIGTLKIEQEEDRRKYKMTFNTSTLTTILYKGSTKKKNGTNVCSGRRNRVSIEQGSRLHSINGIKQRTL